jgi:dTDP-4-amino-4,6-dideoxygalactose transaminase
LLNTEKFIERTEKIWEKGTNRKKYFRGEIDKYTWVDIGSSVLPSEIIAAFVLCDG